MRALAFIALTATAIAAPDIVLPEPFAKDRYEQTRTNSPFVLATIAPPELTVAKTKFSEAMYLTGLGRADGREYVIIVRVGDEARPIRLSGSTPNEDGIAVHQIEWSDAFGKSKVKLTKGGEVEEVGFNENAAKSRSPIPITKAPPSVGGKPTAPANKGAGRIRVIH